MRRWCVYMHEHRVSGKKYIGITGQRPEKRWQNGRGYEGCPRFDHAIRKYGWDAFRHEILYTGLTQEDAERLEIELIAKYDTTNSVRGYNSAQGGGAPRPTAETIAKMKAAARKRMENAHTRAKIRAANLGKILGAETREKLRAAALGRTMPQPTRAKISETMHGRVPYNRAAVQCVETGKIYASMGEAEKQTGVNRSRISLCCRNKPGCNTAGGYHWQFVDK